MGNGVFGAWYLARIEKSKILKEALSPWHLAINKSAQPASLDWYLVLGTG
jgi:hypothetical protein